MKRLVSLGIAVSVVALFGVVAMGQTRVIRSGSGSSFSDSASLRALLSDETGTGLAVFGTSPTFTTPILGVATATSLGVGNGTSAAPALVFTSDPDAGWYRSGASQWTWTASGNPYVFFSSSTIRLASGISVSWTPTSAIVAADLFLVRDAANVLAQRNTTNPQTFRLYNTYTDASNYERGFLSWVGTTFDIGTESLGTGGGRSTRIRSSSSIYLSTAGSDRWSVNSSGMFLPQGTTNTLDIGAAGSTIRSLYVGTSIVNSGDMSLRHIVAAGTAPTLDAGCGTGTLATGASDVAGKITTNTTGACTIVLTFGTAWARAPSCSVNNETTANLSRSTTTTTTATLTGTTVSGDVWSYHCLGY